MGGNHHIFKNATSVLHKRICLSVGKEGFMKYIIDTDIGDDIDDAFAFDLALKKDLDLVCVTTVFRNTRERAQIAKRMCALFGVDVPVYAGYGDTLGGNVPTQGRLCQWTSELEKYAPDNVREEEAVDAIVAAARRYGPELTVLALGPLTNLARAIGKDAEAMRSIGGIVMMGGDFRNHYAEWNICSDAEAADCVFSSGVPVTAFGHEVTSRMRLTREEQEYVFSMRQDTYHAYLSELSRLWYASKPAGWRMVLHDVMVVRYALDSAYCRMACAPVAVELEGRYTRGMTVNLSKMDSYRPGDGTFVNYAAEADAKEFIAYFMRGLGYAAKPVHTMPRERGRDQNNIRTREEIL